MERDEEIRQLAYRMWEQAGCPVERDQEFWHMAEQQIAERSRFGNGITAVPIGPGTAVAKPKRKAAATTSSKRKSK